MSGFNEKSQLTSLRMHLNLFFTIGENLPTSSQDFKDFLTFTAGLLNPRDIELNKESAEDILKALERAGYISVGDYRRLKRILSDAKLGKLLLFVDKEERKIKEQLKLERPREKASNVPSEPVSGAVSSPGIVKPNNAMEDAIKDVAKVIREQDYDKAKDYLEGAGKVVLEEIEKVDVKSVVDAIGKWAKWSSRKFWNNHTKKHLSGTIAFLFVVLLKRK